jgi:uncharacterized membrane protein YidH (DUF202 family)
MVALSFLLAPGVAYAATDASKEALCGGAGLVGGGNGCTAQSGSSVDSVLKRGLNLFSAIIGIIAVVMIMVGGLKYITSQGDASNTAAAKNTILYAAIGLVVVALAQVIVRFVLDRFA